MPDGHYRCFLEDAGVDFAAWFPRLGPGYDHDATGVWSIPVEFHDSTWVGDRTTAFIRNRAAEDAPWFAWASFQDPHEPHVCPREWMDRVDPEAIAALEGFRLGEFEAKPDFYRQAYEAGNFGGIDDVYGAPCASRRQALHATLGMIAGIDEQVGRLLAALESTDKDGNTVVIFTSDHGEYHGHHGFWGKGLPAFEDVHRVPLLAWGLPWRSPPP